MNGLVVEYSRRAKNDSGATLLLAMFIITGVALVVGALLSQSFTNTAATVGLRKQSAASYAADSAAQYAVNQVRLTSGNFAPGALCSGTGTTTKNLTNFYPAGVGTPAMSATIECRPDLTNLGSGGDPLAANTSPGSALLALGTATGEPGIYANVGKGPVRIRGGVFSNSDIRVPGGLTNTWRAIAPVVGTTYNLARGFCTGDLTIQYVGTQKCELGPSSSAPDIRGEDPGTLTPHGASYDQPALPLSPPVIRSCTGFTASDPPSANHASCSIVTSTTPNPCAAGKKYQSVSPGAFVGMAGLAELDALTGCTNKVIWFKPGIYHFNIPSVWNVPKGYVVAGTFDAANASPAADPSGWGDGTEYGANFRGFNACFGPGSAGATTTSGVNFVMGGSSRIAVNENGDPGAHATICASNSASGPPIAIYGLKASSSNPLADCVPQGALAPASGTSCAVISSGYSPKAILTIKGTTYVTRGVISIGLNNRSKKLFFWGLIARGVEFNGSNSADVSNDLIDVPDSAPNPFPAVNAYYLRVFVCPGANSCSTGVDPDLQGAIRAKSATPGGVEVLGWSAQR